MDTTYLRALKTALLGDPTGRLVLLCNFEVETVWARQYPGLPNPGLSSSTLLVQRMEELGVLLAGPDDALVLKRPLDAGYRRYLEDLGFSPPTVMVPENVDDARSTAEDALASPVLLNRLATAAAGGAQLLPMGTSVLEQKLAESCGLPLASPDAAMVEQVNSKIYGRRLAEAAGLRCVPGICCETGPELSAALRRYRARLAAGSPVVVKDAYGVSGKGLVVLDSPAKADRLVKMVQRQMARTGDWRLFVVVEEWLPKRLDLNYQVTVDRAGGTRLDFIKQAITRNGVHQGHLMPAELSVQHRAEVEQAAHAAGTRLFADGFFGVIGIDAVLCEDDTLYPILEINARLNMSTYQGSVTERFQPAGHRALARHYPLNLDRALPFDELRATLGPLLVPTVAGQLIITCFGTVNANATATGRLYALLIAADEDRLTAMDRATEAALARLFRHEEDR
jgi:hypothetical protein